MRHLFFILMIALLPLRGWVSDAMATSMVTVQVQQYSTTKTIAINTHEARTSAQKDAKIAVVDAQQADGDCVGHTADDKNHEADTHCNACSACQACHAVALSLVAAHLTTASNPRTLPRAAVAQFISAERALDQKPPIS